MAWYDCLQGRMDDEDGREDRWMSAKVEVFHDDVSIACTCRSACHTVLTTAKRAVFAGSTACPVCLCTLSADWPRLARLPLQGNLFDAFDLKIAESPAVEVAWIPVYADMDLCGEQEKLLEYVARHHDAYWSTA